VSEVDARSSDQGACPVDNGEVSHEAARSALTKLLADPRFHASERNRRFLRFVVEEALAGNASRIKSYTIAVDVFGRGSDFDASIDPIVRIEATRLRTALGNYYADAGRDEEIQVRLPKGGYVPSFARVEPAPPDARIEVAKAAQEIPQGPNLRTSLGAIPRRHRVPATASLIALLAMIAIGIALILRDYSDAVASGPPVVLVAATQSSPDNASAQQIATGFTQALLLALSRYDGLRVIQMPAAMTAAAALTKLGADKTHPIAAAYVLESNVRQDTENIRFWWVLKDARTNETVWTDVADRSRSKGMTIGVEDQVAQKVGTVIGQPQGLIAMQQIAYERSQPTEGYGCVLRSRAYYLSISEPLHREIRECLENAVSLSPDYAEAWAMLAFIYLDEDRNHFNRRATAEDALDRAVKAAQRAAELAPQSETAQEALMGVHYRRGDFDAAFRAGRRAIEINPHNPELLSALGIRLFARGQWDEGAAMVRTSIEQALVVPPLDRFTLVFDDYRKQDYKAALAQADLIELPKYYFVPLVRAAIHGQLGNIAEARENIDALLRLRPDYASEMRRELRSRHYTEPLIDMLAEGLQKAGLTVL